MEQPTYCKTYCLEVTGDWACFTRPELSVERVSYAVMTPSAARAVYEAIFRKPSMRWHISHIAVMNPIKWINIRRNEVKSLMSENTLLFVDEERQRTQRHGLFLRDVCYRIYAKFQLRNPGYENKQFPYHTLNSHLDEPYTGDSNGEENVDLNIKYMAMFEKRLAKGQCFHQPYLGCREFAADYRLIETDDGRKPISVSCDLGFMVFDKNYNENPDDPKPMMFHAYMNDGVIKVPSRESHLVIV